MTEATDEVTGEISGSHRITEADYSGYQQPEPYRGFVHQVDANTHEITFVAEGIRCVSCALAIENGLMAVTGVQTIQVNPSTRHGTLRWDPNQAQLADLLKRIDRLGFTPHPLRPDGRQAIDRREYRAALKRLIVAGLGTMQVMTYAVALYAGAFADMPFAQQVFFRYLSLLIATPVVFYSAAPFFSGALADVQQHRAGMDVPVALAIGIAYSASVIVTLFGDLHQQVYFDSAVMFTFFLSFGRLAEMLVRHRSIAVSEALMATLPAHATRLEKDEQGQWQQHTVATNSLKANDRILIKPGETIAADGEIVQGVSSTDNALLTGESQPVSCRPGVRVVGGSINLTGPIHVLVLNTGTDTVISGIARLLVHAQSQRPRLARYADQVAGYFVAGVLTIATLVACVWLFVDPGNALSVTLAVLVVTCPCALSLATPAALSAATDLLARNGVLVTRGSALETLAKVGTVLLDKTGTLTHGKPELVNSHLLDTVLSDATCRSIAAALEAGSTHPAALALQGWKIGSEARSVQEFPGLGIEGIVDNVCYRIGRLDFVSAIASRSATAQTGNEATMVYLGDANSLLAAFELRDTLRCTAQAATGELRSAGLDLVILSGDASGPVASVAQTLAIDNYQSQMLPADKLSYLQQRRSHGEILAMVGDGINDAPVLAGADVSIALGSGSMLAQASADLILPGSDLGKLTYAIRVSRRTMGIIRQNLTWAILYNAVALPLAAFGMIAPWMAALGMSASSLLVVLNALRLSRNSAGTDSVVAVPTMQQEPSLL